MDCVRLWLHFRASVRCFLNLSCVFLHSNRMSFISPERDGINSARIFANSVSGEEEESYIHMVIFIFTQPSFALFCSVTLMENAEVCFLRKNVEEVCPLPSVFLKKWWNGFKPNTLGPIYGEIREALLLLCRTQLFAHECCWAVPRDHRDQPYLHENSLRQRKIKSFHLLKVCPAKSPRKWQKAVSALPKETHQILCRNRTPIKVSYCFCFGWWH